MRIEKLSNVLLCGILFMMTGCAALPPKESFKTPDFTGQVAAGEWVSKVDRFYVVMDASSSMNDPYEGRFNPGYSKFIVEKDILRLLNKSIPPLDMEGGLAAFGLHPRISDDLAVEFYNADPYIQDDFQEALGEVKVAGGTTPMAIGIGKAAEALKGKEGPAALILVGDGHQTSYDAAGTAKALKAELGDDLCIYTVAVGADAKGTQLLESIAEAGGCGFATTADAIADTNGMADFVKQVFLAEAPPQAASAPAPKITWILSDVFFDFDKWDLRPDAKETLTRDLAILKENPQINVEIQGHTDDIGTAEYNQMLSEKRAQSVMNFMIENGIDPARLKARGYGEERPRFPNDSEENRARNRRVEMVPFE